MDIPEIVFNPEYFFQNRVIHCDPLGQTALESSFHLKPRSRPHSLFWSLQFFLYAAMLPLKCVPTGGYV